MEGLYGSRSVATSIPRVRSGEFRRGFSRACRTAALIVLGGLFPVGAQEAESTAEPSLEERVKALEQTVRDQQELLDELTKKRPWMISYWREGLRFETADLRFTARVGGRLFNDWSFFSPDRKLKNQLGSLDDSVEFRSARLGLRGTINRRFEYKVDYDFAGGDSDFKDLYIGVTGLPADSTFRVGHVKEPFGLEQLTSGRFLTFLERALPDVLVPGRNTGFLAFGRVIEERLLIFTKSSYAGPILDRQG